MGSLEQSWAVGITNTAKVQEDCASWGCPNCQTVYTSLVMHKTYCHSESAPNLLAVCGKCGREMMMRYGGVDVTDGQINWPSGFLPSAIADVVKFTQERVYQSRMAVESVLQSGAERPFERLEVEVLERLHGKPGDPRNN